MFVIDVYILNLHIHMKTNSASLFALNNSVLPQISDLSEVGITSRNLEGLIINHFPISDLTAKLSDDIFYHKPRNLSGMNEPHLKAA